MQGDDYADRSYTGRCYAVRSYGGLARSLRSRDQVVNLRRHRHALTSMYLLYSNDMALSTLNTLSFEKHNLFALE